MLNCVEYDSFVLCLDLFKVNSTICRKTGVLKADIPVSKFSKSSHNFLKRQDLKRIPFTFILFHQSNN